MAGFDSTLSTLGIGRTGASQAAKTTPASSATTMSQGDFLTLMTAQLKNQDPFEPVDNTQMVAQMAQFSSLAGISEMNSTLSAIAERLGATSVTDALGWVGKHVLTEGNTAYPMANGAVTGAIEIDAKASDVMVSIEGPNGAVLKTVSLGPQDAGTLDFAWDGTTDSGDPPGDGPFTIRVAAQNADGGSVPVRALVWAPVDSVQVSNGAPVLTIPGLGQVPASAVRKIG